MEILTAYVRHNAPLPPEADQERTEAATDEQHAMERPVGKAETKLSAVDPDIQAIMTVLRRRTSYHKQVEYERLDLSETNLTQAILSGADLSGEDLYGAVFYEADLSGANLSHQADLYRANLYRANLYGADLYGEDRPEADLYGAYRLTQEQLEQAEGDENTQLPPHLKPPAHWGVKTAEQPEED